MDAISNVTIASATNVTSPEAVWSNERTSRVDWVVPVTVNLALIVVTTLILVSLVHYGLRSGKWRGRPTTQADQLNAGVVYTFLIVCAVMCIARYIVNQIYINAGFDSDENNLCEAAGDAAFTSYSMILWSVSIFLWFRQKAFYTNHMLAFRLTRGIRVLSYSSAFLINASGFAYLLFFTIPTSYEAGSVGCVYKAEDNLRIYYGIYVALLIFFSHLLLLCLFIYPVMQVGRNAKPLLLKGYCCFETFTSTKPQIDDSSVTSTNEPSSSEMGTMTAVHRVKSLAVRPPSDGIKRIIRKTLIFAVASAILDVMISMISYFVPPPSGNRRYINLMFDVAAFCNLLFLVFSFSTYKNMLTSCIRRSS